MKSAIVLVPDDRDIEQEMLPILVPEGKARWLLSMGINRFRRRVREGRIPFVIEGGKRRFLTSELRAYTDSLPKGDPESLPKRKIGHRMRSTTKPKPQEVQPCP